MLISWMKKLVKTLVWMALGVALFYVLTGDWKVLGAYFVIRTIMYYTYEWVWSKW